MCKRTKLGLNILEAALLLGALGDALLRETPWGLNVPVWACALGAAMYALHARWGRESLRADGGWLFAPLVFFAAAFAWRDSATLKLLDGLALFAALALLAWRVRGRRIRVASLGDYALGLGHAAFDVLFASLPLVLSDIRWATIPRNGAMRHAWAVARGLAIAVPLLFLFGALLMAADAVFEGIMRQTFQLDIASMFSHFFLTLLFAWMTGGFLRGMMSAEAAASNSAPPAAVGAVAADLNSYTSITADDAERGGAAHAFEASGHRAPPQSVVVGDGAATTQETNGSSQTTNGNAQATTGAAQTATGAEQAASQATLPAGAPPSTSHTDSPVMTVAAQRTSGGFSFGAVEVGVVLGSLDVLFACFVAVQFRYFFGGAARVMSVTELTYAEYARRGFFELTWVAGLLLPLLLIAHALVQRRNSPAAARIFRPLAAIQVALLFVIMASAIARMRLYQSEYGLTELRLYTTAFMLWLGLVFVWFAWTVLVRARRERFACGALVAAFLTIGLLHLLNPDAYIVRANAAHARAGRSFDAEYAASLSADAVPALISALPALTHDERCIVARQLSVRWSQTALLDEDWRAWSLARSRARRAVAAGHVDLSAATCPPPASSLPVFTAPPDPALAEPPPPPTAMRGNAETAASDSGSGGAATTMHMLTAPEGAAKSAKTDARGHKRKSKNLKRARARQRAKAR